MNNTQHLYQEIHRYYSLIEANGYDSGRPQDEFYQYYCQQIDRLTGLILAARG